jgi:hypothetical protein
MPILTKNQSPWQRPAPGRVMLPMRLNVTAAQVREAALNANRLICGMCGAEAPEWTAEPCPCPRNTAWRQQAGEAHRRALAALKPAPSECMYCKRMMAPGSAHDCPGTTPGEAEQDRLASEAQKSAARAALLAQLAELGFAPPAANELEGE